MKAKTCSILSVVCEVTEPLLQEGDEGQTRSGKKEASLTSGAKLDPPKLSSRLLLAAILSLSKKIASSLPQNFVSAAAFNPSIYPSIHPFCTSPTSIYCTNNLCSTRPSICSAHSPPRRDQRFHPPHLTPEFPAGVYNNSDSRTRSSSSVLKAEQLS